MIEVATIKFFDLESHSEAVAIVRCDIDRVMLCLSVFSENDIEVSLDRAVMSKLVEALQLAIASGP